MPRYVILHHVTPPEYPRPTHWDLLLEDGETLRAWALLANPQGMTPQWAEELPPHRRKYLTYEGPVSGNRGHVTQWDAGEYEVVSSTAVELTITLAGRRLRGVVELAATDTDDDLPWTYLYLPQP